MDESTFGSSLETLPTQSAAVWRGVMCEGTDAAGPGALHGEAGVAASQSVCDGLHGPAKSLCYSAVYGVSV